MRVASSGLQQQLVWTELGGARSCTNQKCKIDHKLGLEAKQTKKAFYMQCHLLRQRNFLLVVELRVGIIQQTGSPAWYYTPSRGF